MAAGLSRRSALCLGLGVGLAEIARTIPGHAEPLAPPEIARLRRGDLLAFPRDFHIEQGDYFGGVSYAVIEASPQEVMGALTDPSRYRRILPHTLEARITTQRGESWSVFLRQGGKLTSVSYSLWLRRESPSLLRFWLDPSEPHDIADCWGFFRVAPWQNRASLLTYAALLRLESGLIRYLFAERIRAVALRMPLLVRAECARADGPTGTTSR